MHIILRFTTIVVMLCYIQCAFADDKLANEKATLRIVTTVYSPYSYEERGEPKGYSVAIIKALMDNMSLVTDIEVMPWARTYKTALNRPNTLIFSIARTPEREDLFHWVGKLFPMKTYLYIAAHRSDIDIKTLDDVRKYVIAGVIEGAPSKWLEAQGIRMFNSSGLHGSRIRMLVNDRVDVLLADPMSLEAAMTNSNIEMTQIKPIMYLPQPSYDLYFALSKGTDPSYIEAFQNAYQNLVEKGQLQQLTQPFHERYKHLSIAQ
ncbi:MAG: substrate-binding periplasmic protein [Aestuariibacter sp.]